MNNIGGKKRTNSGKEPGPQEIIPEHMEGQDDHHSSLRLYFKRLRLRFTVGLLIAFLLPHILLSAYFHFQFAFTLKNTGKLNLEALSRSQQNTIDLFLQERVVNLFSLFHSKEFSLTPSRHLMEYYLQSLRQVSDAFIDVGFLSADGIKVGYAGPFPYLQGRDYSQEKWFKALMNQKRDYYISDIYMGFRGKPHFTIAARQMIDNKFYIVRSTLDPDKFYMFLRTISRGKEVESALINNKGLYQVVDPDRGELLGKCDYRPPLADASGANELIKGGDTILIAHAWLKEAPWALLVRQPLTIAHARMYQTRRIMTTSLGIILITITALIWFAASWLIGRAQVIAEKSEDLQHELAHVSKLASVGELATGVAHEINNPLAVITATSGVIRDMLDPEFDLDPSPENILEELDNIDSVAYRAKKITHQLLDIGRKTEPRLASCNVNQILDELMGGLKEREFKVENIEIHRNYDPDLPEILLDPDKIRQVFLNLINNAGDAISGSGTITISTRKDGENIKITIEDTGEGMTPKRIGQIFNPFYSTKKVGEGTGLGLSVSLSIVESLGGAITVQSLKGAGSLFEVSLPITKPHQTDNGGKKSGKQ